MISLDDVVAKVPGQVSCDLGEEIVILGLRDGVYYGLDAVGARIWALLQDTQTVRQVRDRLMEEYDVSLAECEKDLIGFLESMLNWELITVGTTAGTSRSDALNAAPPN